MNANEESLPNEVAAALATAISVSVKAIAARSMQPQGFTARAIAGDLLAEAQKIPVEFERAKSMVIRIADELQKP